MKLLTITLEIDVLHSVWLWQNLILTENYQR
uniref:Uncharacterized protein n=1 Tax=Anguilla anguilla TaxID=7936 RepID=A0A0E9SCX6_ANGAN